MFKYVVNISSAEVQMIDGKVKVPFRDYVPVSAKEAAHDDVVDCIRKKWIMLLEYEPNEQQMTKLLANVEDRPSIEFTPPPELGLTEFPKDKVPVTPRRVLTGEPSQEPERVTKRAGRPATKPVETQEASAPAQ